MVFDLTGLLRSLTNAEVEYVVSLVGSKSSGPPAVRDASTGS